MKIKSKNIKTKKREEILIENLRDIKEIFDKYHIKFWLDWGTLLGAIRDGKIIKWDYEIDLGVMGNDFEKITSLLPKLEKKGFSVIKIVVPTQESIDINHIKFYFSRFGYWIDIWAYHKKDEDNLVTFYANVSNNLVSRNLWRLWRLLMFREVSIFSNPNKFKLAITLFLKNCLFLFPYELKEFFAKIAKQILIKNNYITLVQSVVPKHYFEELKTIEFYGMTLNIPSDVEGYLKYKYGEDWRTPKRKWNWTKEDRTVTSSIEHSNFPSEVSGTKGWLATRFSEFLNLLKMVRLRCPLKIIIIQATELLTYTLIYPIPRILLGRRKIQNLLSSFSETLNPIIIPFPSPLKSRIMLYWFSSFGLFSEIYLENVYSKEALKEGMNVIDVGASVGPYTVLAAEKVGKTGRVITIEPGPKNYKLLLENIKLNNFQNVIPKNIALAGHEGFEKLYLSSSFAGHSLIFHEDRNSYINIPVTTIDKLVEELNIKKIDIVKIDAEGVEIPILKGAEKTLKNNPNIKMIVASYHYPSQVKEVRQFLNERGFKTKVSSGEVVMTI